MSLSNPCPYPQPPFDRKMPEFEVVYSINDGYVGYRPKKFRIDLDELDPDMSPEELEEYYTESMEEHFRTKVYPEAQNKEQFMTWAQEQLPLVNEN